MAKRLAVGVLCVAVGFVVMLVLVRTGLQFSGGWALAGQAVGALCGLGVSCVLRATTAASVWAAMAAMTIAELAVRVWFGMPVIQGGPVRIGLAATAVLGVALGFWIARQRSVPHEIGRPAV